MLNVWRRWETFILTLFICSLTFGEFLEECGERESIYIKSSKNCSIYTFCYGEDSFTAECDEDTPYFSEIDQTCDSNPEVCDEVETTSSTGQDISSLGSSSGTTSTPIKSSSKIPMTSTTLNPTASSTVSSSSSSVVTTVISQLASKCPLQDNPEEIIFIADNKSCSNYFMCYHGEALPMECIKALHFDPITQKCDYPEKVKCQLESSSAREKCHARAFGAYSHPTNCNYYYLCRYGYLMVMQCPQNSEWDYEKRACIRRGEAKCYASLLKKVKGS